MAYQNYETMTAHRPLPPMAAAVFALAVTVLKWEQRQQTRRSLAKLDAHLLKDVGLSAQAAEGEMHKPFWQD